MTIKTLAEKQFSNVEISRMLGLCEGSVRYHRGRLRSGQPDGRSLQPHKAAALADAIEHWRSQILGDDHEDAPVNLLLLHEWLVAEHGYTGSLRSVQRYWKATYPAPKIRARRRVELMPGAQAQADWADYPGTIVGGESVYLREFRLVLSHSRGAASVWSLAKDQLSWIACHTAALLRLGGVPAIIRVDNEKTAVVKGAGAWGVINATYRRYADLMRFHVDACPPRSPWTKGKIERNVRVGRFGADPRRHTWSNLEELQAWSDDESEKSARRRRCPATGTSAWDAWQAERSLLTPVPDPCWAAFDIAVTRPVGIDSLVSFENRQYQVPLAYVGRQVEVRGCAHTVQILAANTLLVEYERGTPERLLLRPEFYDVDSTTRVCAPPPLGKMGRRLMELASEPVQYRSAEIYARVAEVAR